MASTHRLVAEMVGLGLLEKGADRSLRVGVRLWELGWRSTSALGLRDIAMPYLEDLQSVVRQHTQLALPEGTDVLYIERLSARGQTTLNITRVAGRLPAHTCSSGLVLLAFGPPEPRYQRCSLPRAESPGRYTARIRPANLVCSCPTSAGSAATACVPTRWLRPDTAASSCSVNADSPHLAERSPDIT
jgi:DNA-binding IclR family transcriptional regulator